MRTSAWFSMAACAGLCIALTACAPAQQPVTPSDKPVVSDEPTPGVAPEPQGPVSLSDLEVTLKPVARGFEAPVQVTGAGDGSGRLFVVEQAGTIRVIENGKALPGSFLDVRRKVSFGGERGLLGLAFDPDYASNGRFYVNYTDGDGDTVVERYTAQDPTSSSPKLGTSKRLFSVAQPYPNHNGGCLAFEPGTTRLWIGMGDGGSGGDPEDRAQDPDSLLGKMLVLDVSTDGKPQIVQKGLRNPWRFSFDRANSDLWIGDVGQVAWEEIDTVPLIDARGVNWGWNRYEGTHPYPEGSKPTSKKGLTFPVFEYGRDVGKSVTGGFVYRGTEYPALVGTYFYGDFVDRWVGALRGMDASSQPLAKVEQRIVVEPGTLAVSSFGEDDDGELYVVDYGGTVYQVTGAAR